MCPKFSIALIPDSFSSLVTIFDFVFIDCSITIFKVDSFRSMICFDLSSMSFFNVLFPMNEYFMTSPRPDLYSSSDKVLKYCVEINTHLGL